MFINKVSHQNKWTIPVDNSILYTHSSQEQIRNVYEYCQHYKDYYLPQFVKLTIEINKIINKSMLIINSNNFYIISSNNLNYHNNNNTKNISPNYHINNNNNNHNNKHNINNNNNNQLTLRMLIQILKQQRFIYLQIIQQIKFSYKGYISWIIIGTSNKIFLIDSAILHDQCYQLKNILENNKIVKFTHNHQEIINSFKRDFGIFMTNIFDLQIIKRFMNKNTRQTNNLIYIRQHYTIKQSITTQLSHLIPLRPISPQLQTKIQQNSINQYMLIMNIINFINNEDKQYQFYAYFNHYQFLLKPYFHYIKNIQQYQYDNNNDNEVQKQKELKEKQGKQSDKICSIILEWRQHIARIKDISVEEMLKYQNIKKLTKSKINSILQISEILSSDQNNINNKINNNINKQNNLTLSLSLSNKQNNLSSLSSSHKQSHLYSKSYSLSLQQIQQIFQLIQLDKQTKQQHLHQHEINIPKRLPYFKSSQQKPFKQLFKTISLNQNNNNNNNNNDEWLNKKNDQAIKMYKEIVSITQFDNSIVEEYINSDKNNQNHMKIQHINNYVKYAQYLRNNNHNLLQQLYQKQLKKNIQNHSIIKYNHNKYNNNNKYEQQEQPQQNWINQHQQQHEDNNQLKNKWYQIQTQLNLPTMNSINNICSTSSLSSINSQQNIQSNINININKNIKSTKISLKQLKQNSINSFNSISSLQCPTFIKKVQPLPENIQSIYVEAAKIKKTSTKLSKKKCNKKQNNQNINKKQEDFIPKKEEIFDLIHY